MKCPGLNLTLPLLLATALPAQTPELGQPWSVPSVPGLSMLWCAPGSFSMGSPEGELGHQSDETRHKVILLGGFWLGKYEVTQTQWKTVWARASAINGTSMPLKFLRGRR